MKRVLCKIFGHKRGKRVSAIGGELKFACPRCEATWTRKIRKAKA